MKTRSENIVIINGLYGLDRDLLNDTIGYFGDNFKNYTDEQLDKFRLLSEDLEESAQLFIEQQEEPEEVYFSYDPTE